MAEEISKTDAPTAEAVKAEAAPAAAEAQAAATEGTTAANSIAAEPAPVIKAARKRAAAKAKPAPAPARAAPAVDAKPAARRTTKAPVARSLKKTARRKPAKAAAEAVSTKTVIMNEGIRTMFNDTNVAERLQAVFGDANERAKTAIERNTRIAEELTELGRGNVEAVVASTKVAARGIETLGQDVAEFGRKSFEDASAALKSFAEVKTPADFFRLQTEFARTQFDALVAESSKLSETVIKLAGEVAEPITNRATVAAERVRTAVAL
jgi:phasin family protein